MAQQDAADAAIVAAEAASGSVFDFGLTAAAEANQAEQAGAAATVAEEQKTPADETAAAAETVARFLQGAVEEVKSPASDEDQNEAALDVPAAASAASPAGDVSAATELATFALA